MKLNYRDVSDRVQSVMKTSQDNNIIDYIGMVYAKNDTELSWPIGPDAVCFKNQTKQRRD